MDLNEIALGRCGKLLRLAREVFDSEPALSKRYVALARKIAERHRLHLGSREFCRKCGVVWIPGKTLRVRQLSAKKIVAYTCVDCGYARRFSYGKRKRKTL
ncbi:ribonuclease P, partial [Candidatus Micrarchaeota archaeon]|nr:ribonuclease P [Candidatus Micrarchaeota archaeon]